MPQAPKSQNPQDNTGRIRQQQLKEKADKEKAEAEAEAARLAEEASKSDEVVNTTDIEYSNEDDENDSEEPKEVGGIVDLGEIPEEVEVSKATRVIRINATVDPTIGVGNEYHFEEGRKYRVPAHVADHLDEKGYVWH